MNFKEKLQLYRKQKNLSQEGLANKIGVSRQTVAKWELGHSLPDAEKLIIISSVLSISIDRLLKTDESDCNIQILEHELKEQTEIISFLCKAKKETYAKGKGKQSSSRPLSIDYHYNENDYNYIDSYLGNEIFSGGEIVYFKMNPIWTMNYCGRVLAEEFSGSFLKEALLNVDSNYPYRGPLFYQKGDYSYHCIINGAFEWFQGYEEIFCNNKKIYECYFHGGNLK